MYRYLSLYTYMGVYIYIYIEIDRYLSIYTHKRLDRASLRQGELAHGGERHRAHLGPPI